MRLVEQLGAVRLRSDVERKRLFGEQNAQSAEQLHTGIYSNDASAATYQRLHQLATGILHSGMPVVIDATYLKHAQREAAWQVAEAVAMPFLILDCQAPQAVIEQWLAQRTAEGGDPSDATLAVIQAQQASREALSSDELAHSKTIDTHDQSSLDSLISRIQLHFKSR
jgi:predicted kinase